MWSGWAAGRSFFVVEGGGRMADDGRRGDGCRLAPGFVGGWLLRRWKSAKTVFQKSELASLKQRTFEKQRRFPPPKKRTPSAEAEPARYCLPGWHFKPEGTETNVNVLSC